MKNYPYQNHLIDKKRLKQILTWSFKTFDCIQASRIADELKFVGFNYATKSGLSISIEDLKIPPSKEGALKKAQYVTKNLKNQYLKGQINDGERLRNIFMIWSYTSEFLKNQITNHFKKYDPLNSVYIMAFSGARGNITQVKQLITMRGLMATQSGEIITQPIIKNFREGLSITDYLISSYGARKGIIDTALKTANSGYLTRRLVDVSQDIIIREKDCKTHYSVLIFNSENLFHDLFGRVLNKTLIDPKTYVTIAHKNTQITPELIEIIQQKKIPQIYIRSPFTCKLYRAMCQKCYGWNLATENLVDMGEAIGILAGQSIGEPGTQLTMRTFHTGGSGNTTIKTQAPIEKLYSPASGLVKLSKYLDVRYLRTNYGENLLIVNNSSYLMIIPKSQNHVVLKVKLKPGTILFINSNQSILKNSVLGELNPVNRYMKKEQKILLSNNAGQIIMPTSKNNLSNKTHKLFWLLFGAVFNSPLNSYINLYSDFKLLKDSFIFRTKILNSYSSKVTYNTKTRSLYQNEIKIKNNFGAINSIKFFKLPNKINNANAILKYKNYQYLVFSKFKNYKIYLKRTRQNYFAKLISNFYMTKTGGTVYYDIRSLEILNQKNSFIRFYDCKFSHLQQRYKRYTFRKSYIPLINFARKFSSIFFNTLIWLEEEVHHVDCEIDRLLVKNGEYIKEKFEILPNRFSKVSGIVEIYQKNNRVKIIKIKPGLCGKWIPKNFQSLTDAEGLYFPGEKVFANFITKLPIRLESVNNLSANSLLFRYIKLYEFPKFQNLNHVFDKKTNIKDKLNLTINRNHLLKSYQTVSTNLAINLVSDTLKLNLTYPNYNNYIFELNQNQKLIDIKKHETIKFNNYIIPTLKYKNLESCSLIQKNQFLDYYTILGYIESIMSTWVEIIKINITKSHYKKILVVSNNDCNAINKKTFPFKKINEFILNSSAINHIGRIIMETDNLFIVQKGQPYFFPNHQIKKLSTNKIIKVALNKRKSQIYPAKILNLKQFNKFEFRFDPKFLPSGGLFYQAKQFKGGNLFFQNNGNLYTCMIPRFFKQFTIGTTKNNPLINSELFNYKDSLSYAKNITLWLQNSEIISNKSNKSIQPFRLTLIRFLKHPFPRSVKSLYLYSISENFEKKKLLNEQNFSENYCYHNQFIEKHEPIGTMETEKEMTDDIVQGLPRIERMLEARKGLKVPKRVPINQRTGLVTQNPSVKSNLGFVNIGICLQEKDKQNPHRLVKAYFDYYGAIKSLICDRKCKLKHVRLFPDNVDAAYRCLKKAQAFIFHYVQGVYKSQGVNINARHLEVIIRQMTTKVIISNEGKSGLMQNEIVDLYHMKMINKQLNTRTNRVSFAPILLGITRSALNNPSFLSAASFQQAVQVLTKTAINGRSDWLQGLKENIIVGHLIPAGTGFSQNEIEFPIQRKQ